MKVKMMNEITSKRSQFFVMFVFSAFSYKEGASNSLRRRKIKSSYRNLVG